MTSITKGIVQPDIVKSLSQESWGASMWRFDAQRLCSFLEDGYLQSFYPLGTRLNGMTVQEAARTWRRPTKARVSTPP